MHCQCHVIKTKQYHNIQSTSAISKAAFLELSACRTKLWFPWIFSCKFHMISAILNRFSGLVLIICLISQTSSKRVQDIKRVPKEKRYYGCTGVTSFDNRQILIWLTRLHFVERKSWKVMKSMFDFRTSFSCRLKTLKSLLFLVSFFWQDIGDTEVKAYKQNFEREMCCIKEVEKGQSSEDITAKYFRPKTTSSIWI